MKIYNWDSPLDGWHQSLKFGDIKRWFLDYNLISDDIYKRNHHA